MRRSLRLLATSAAATSLLAAPALAAVPDGRYRGDTSQDRTVHATVKKGKLASLSFSVFLRCGTGGSGGSTTDALAVRNVKIKANGAFTVKSEGDSSNGLATYVLKGKVTRTRVTGSIEQLFRNGCQTFDLTFSAKRR